MLIITNNSKVREYYERSYPIRYIDGSYRDVLICARDFIHKGHRLLTHPLSGSVKPGETPYKSLVITEAAGSLDFPSLELIEQAIAVFEKFVTSCRHREPAEYTESILEDFSEVDFTLLQSALK